MDEKEKRITCAYDNSHRIKKYRMFRHLIKCEKQHPHIKLNKCPFNSLHRIKPLEMEHHLLVCESRANAASLYCESEPARVLDIITVQEINDMQKDIPLTENWAIEPEVVKSYDPMEHIQEKNIFRSIMLASKSEKRKFKQQERERHSSIVNNTSTSPPKRQVPNLKDELEKPLRLPRQPPKILMQSKVKTDEMAKTSKQSNSMDEDSIIFQRSKNSFQHKDNSISKNDNKAEALNNTNGTNEEITNYPRGLEKTSDQRCSFGRGISLRHQQLAACMKSLINKNTPVNDYTGTFCGYEEESALSMKELEDELKNIRK